MRFTKLTGIYKRRLEFVQHVINKNRVSKILDIGCGTGIYLTIPIAINNPKVNIVGFDIDRLTIYNNINNNKLNNINYKYNLAKDDFHKYDIVILSEVLEHIEEPIRYINKLKKYLKNNGAIILTIPNGYGTFEFSKFIKGINAFLYYNTIGNIFNKKLKQMSKEESGKVKFKNNLRSTSLLCTFNNSQHINFFSYKKIIKIIKITGYYIAAYKARGFIWIENSKFLRQNTYVVEFNEYISDFILPQFVLGWMFELKIDKSRYKYNRNLREKLQCYLNKNYLSKLN